jgi:hypothetical protein
MARRLGVMKHGVVKAPSLFMCAAGRAYPLERGEPGVVESLALRARSPVTLNVRVDALVQYDKSGINVTARPNGTDYPHSRDYRWVSIHIHRIRSTYRVRKPHQKIANALRRVRDAPLYALEKSRCLDDEYIGLEGAN